MLEVYQNLQIFKNLTIFFYLEISLILMCLNIIICNSIIIKESKIYAKYITTDLVINGNKYKHSFIRITWNTTHFKETNTFWSFIISCNIDLHNNNTSPPTSQNSIISSFIFFLELFLKKMSINISGAFVEVLDIAIRRIHFFTKPLIFNGPFYNNTMILLINGLKYELKHLKTVLYVFTEEFVEDCFLLFIKRFNFLMSFYNLTICSFTTNQKLYEETSRIYNFK